jgi:tricorn protease
MDGGYVPRPEFSMYDLDSQWVVENHGVDPDAPVDIGPDQVIEGHDPQLEKAVELVMQDTRQHPKTCLPVRPTCRHIRRSEPAYRGLPFLNRQSSPLPTPALATPLLAELSGPTSRLR